MFKKFIITLVILSIIIYLVGCTGGIVTPPQDNENSLQVEEEENFNVSSNEGGSFKLSDGAELEILPNSLSGDTGIKFSRIIYDPNKDRGTEDHTVFYKLEITGNQVFFLSPIKLILPIYSEVPEENAFIIRVFDDGCFGIIQGEIISKKSSGKFISAEINELGTFTTCSFSLSIVIKIAQVAAESYNFYKLAKGYYKDNDCQSLKSLLDDAKIEEKEAYNYLFQVGLTREDGKKILLGCAESLQTKLFDKENVVALIIAAVKDTYNVIVNLIEIHKAGIAVLDYMGKNFKLKTADYFYDQMALEVETFLAHSTGEAPLEVELDGHVYNGTKPYTYYWEFGNGKESKEYTDNYVLPIRYTYQEPGNYYPILHVKDRYGLEGEARADKVTVQESKHHPVITSTPVTSATKDEPYSYNVDATDSDGDSLTYSLTTKPSGMTINSSTGMINWTPNATGYFNVTVRVSDGELSDTQSYTITVSDDNHSPVITSSPVTSATKDEPYSYNVDATDSDGDFLTYSLTIKPSGMTINSSSGMISWTPSTEGYFNVTVRVFDGELSDTQSYTITVSDDNHSPVISSINAPSSVEINQTTTITCNASDQDGDPLTYYWTKTGGTFEGSTTSSSITWRAPSTQGTYTVSCEVSDGEEEDSKSVNISVGGETYTITASTGSHGSISPSGSVTVNQGLDKSFTITPDTGYQIDDVLVDGSSVGVVNSYTFTNVTEDHTIYATFSLSTANGPVHNLTKDTYYDTIQASLDNANSSDTIEVTDGTYDESIAFPFGKKIILRSENGHSSTIIRGNDGLDTVTLDGSLGGTTLEGFTITHADGQSGRGIYIGSGYLNIDNCTISNNTASSGGGIKNNGTLTITGGTIYNNTAENYGGGIHNASRLTITGNTISDNIAHSRGGGIFNLYSGSLTINEGNISGNSADWYGGGIYNRSDGTLTITGSTISNNTANYYGIYFDTTSETSTIGGNSAYEKNTICGNYKNGSSPSLDQQIGDSSGDLYDTYKDTNYISVYCGEHNYTITASAGSHGSISPSGDVTVYQGSDKTFTITYDTGYQIGDVLVDGNSIGAGSSYTFTNVTQDHTIHATFIIEENGTYSLRDTGPAGGYIFYDKGSYSDGWRYLEAAPVSTEWAGKIWGSYGTFIGGTETGIGTGRVNTNLIVAAISGETDCAAQVCNALVYGGYSDWFLPSKDELNLMYTNLKVFEVGGFTVSAYFGSSEVDAERACAQSFYDGWQYGGLIKDNRGVRSRAVRAF
jgi:hypothetical protein